MDWSVIGEKDKVSGMSGIHWDARNGSWLSDEVFAAMEPWLRDLRPYSGAVHQHGVRARKAIEKAQAQVASLISAPEPEQVIFTSNATESMNLGIRGLLKSRLRFGTKVVTSVCEHPSVAGCLADLQKEGVINVEQCPVSETGFLNPKAFEEALSEEVVLAVTHLVNHDLGVRQDVEALGEVTYRSGAPLLIDGSHGVGWTPVNVGESNVSALTASAARFGGPAGVGVLWASDQARLRPVLFGGAQQGGFKPGLENLPGIVGAGAAAAIAVRDSESRMRKAKDAVELLWEMLAERCPDTIINGPLPQEGRIGGGLNVSFPGVDGEAVVLRADLKGLVIHAGSACVNRSQRIPESLKAIGADEARARGAVLISPGQDMDQEQAKQGVDILTSVVRDLREMGL